VFYLAFMLSMGPLFMRFSKTASDYFRGGGGATVSVQGVEDFGENANLTPSENINM
jgi:hypothetical protein